MFAARSAISVERRAERDAGARPPPGRWSGCGASVKGKWKRWRPAGVDDQRLGDALLDPRSRPPRRRRRGRSGAGRGAAPRCGSSSPASTGTTAVPSRGQRREHLGLRRGDRLDRAEQLDVDRADVGDHRRPRARRSPPARRSGPAPRIAISSTSSSVPVGRLEHGQRQPDLGVEVLAVGVDPPGQQRPGDVLDRGLADRAGDADDPGAERAAPGAGQRLQRRQRVLDREDPARPRSRPGRRATRRPTDDAPGAGRRSPPAANSPPSTRSPRRPKKRSPAAGRAGVDRRPPRRARRRPRRRSRRPSPRRSRSGARGSRRTAQLPQLLAGDLAVVEGDLAAVLELLALLVALAGDHDRVARLGPPEREGDRGAAVDLDLDPVAVLDPGQRLRRRSPPGPRSAGCRR